jgi:hypothetical protein
MDYTNWDNERAALKNEIYKELREQRDREGKSMDSGQITINPQLVTVGESFEYGPFFFLGPFRTAPNMAFAQIRAEADKPFWGALDVSRWETASGAIEGFYVGFLALQAPPEALFTHTVSWIAQGQASVYHQSTGRDAWMDKYSSEYNSTLNIDQ